MPKVDVKQKLTDKIIGMLDAGVVPWQKPWNVIAPMNAVTGRKYKGINVPMLGLEPYSDPRWITYNKASEFGGQVRKGEHGTFIVLWNPFQTQDKDGNDITRFYLKYFNVFNVEQIDGLDMTKLTKVPETQEHDSIASAEAILAGYQNPPSFSHGGNRAFYVPSLDSITVPAKNTFKTVAGYYATRFHEAGHSTGHESRLGRDIRNEFGCGEYSKEELVAEFCNAFLCAHAGIHDTVENSAAYIENWRRVLSMDKNMILECASKGEKAANHILRIEAEQYAVAA